MEEHKCLSGTGILTGSEGQQWEDAWISSHVEREKLRGTSPEGWKKKKKIKHLLGGSNEILRDMKRPLHRKKDSE